MENINMAEFGLLNQYAAFAEEYKREYIVGRILSQEKGLYRLISEKGEQSAVASGKLRYNAKSASDFPAVGDFILIDCNNMQGHAVIHNILPRKSVFIRKAAGTAHTEQIVAANIDTVFICMSLNNDFNIRRLERYLSVAWDSGATPPMVCVMMIKADIQRQGVNYFC
ncbi:MAG: GTPase RsgA [Ruminococcus sp.]